MDLVLVLFLESIKMSNVIESLKDFFKECPIIDDNSPRGEVVKFLQKLLLFFQINVVNFRLPHKFQKLLDGDYPPAPRQTFGDDAVESDETVSLSSVLSAGDERGETESVEDEVQEDIKVEVDPTTFSTASSKFSRRDRGGSGPTVVEQALLMMAENSANQTRIIVVVTSTSSIHISSLYLWCRTLNKIVVYSSIRSILDSLIGWRLSACAETNIWRRCC